MIWSHRRRDRRKKPDMSLNSIVVQGTLKPDGTLELDEKPTLAPGRVHVMLQPVSVGVTPKGSLAETLEEIRRHQQTRGYLGRAPEEIAYDDDQRRTVEDAYEQRMQEIWSQTKTGASAGGS
jgi:ferredoxin-NADP reductase